MMALTTVIAIVATGLVSLAPTTAAFTNANQLVYIDAPHPWQGAEDYCQNTYSAGHLVSITSADEQQIVNDMVVNHQGESTGDDRIIWIGLNDIDNEGTFVWTDGSPLTYTNWGNTEPNNSGGSEDCTHFHFFDHDKDTFVWNDLRCDGASGTPPAFICQLSPDADTDGDGINDVDEVANGSDPLIPDIDTHTELVYVERTVTWPEAQEYCEATYEGGNLVAISSWKRIQEVNDLVTQHEGNFAWIGLNDLDNEGTFVWSDGSPVTYTNWNPGQPDDSGGREDCGHLYLYDEASGFAWNDLPCDVSNTPPPAFICQVPPTPGHDTDGDGIFNEIDPDFLSPEVHTCAVSIDLLQDVETDSDGVVSLITLPGVAPGEPLTVTGPGKSVPHFTESSEGTYAFRARRIAPIPTTWSNILAHSPADYPRNPSLFMYPNAAGYEPHTNGRLHATLSTGGQEWSYPSIDTWAELHTWHTIVVSHSDAEGKWYSWVDGELDAAVDITTMQRNGVQPLTLGGIRDADGNDRNIYVAAPLDVCGLRHWPGCFVGTGEDALALSEGSWPDACAPANGDDPPEPIDCPDPLATLEAAHAATTIEGAGGADDADGDGPPGFLITTMASTEAAPGAVADYGPPASFLSSHGESDARCRVEAGGPSLRLTHADAVNVCGFQRSASDPSKYEGTLAFRNPPCSESQKIVFAVLLNAGDVVGESGVVGGTGENGVAGTIDVDTPLDHVTLSVCSLPFSGGADAGDNEDAVQQCLERGGDLISVAQGDNIMAVLTAPTSPYPGATADTSVRCELVLADDDSVSAPTSGEAVLSLPTTDVAADSQVSSGAVATAVIIDDIPTDDSSSTTITRVRLVCHHSGVIWENECDLWCRVRRRLSRALSATDADADDTSINPRRSMFQAKSKSFDLVTTRSPLDVSASGSESAGQATHTGTDVLNGDDPEAGAKVGAASAVVLTVAAVAAWLALV